MSHDGASSVDEFKEGMGGGVLPVGLQEEVGRELRQLVVLDV